MIHLLHRVARLATATALLHLAIAAHSAELVGRVVSVSDGDTVTILTPSKEQHRVRLAGIDAPESRQAFGQRSKQALSDIAYRQTVVVEWDKRDRYGRIIGKVLVGGVDANLEQIRRGMAWHYKQYAREQSAEDRLRYAKAEDLARDERIGLWRDKDPVPPWDFRRVRRSGAQKVRNEPSRTRVSPARQ